MAHGVILGQKQNTDELLPRDGSRAMEANLNVGNHKVTNVANATAGTDAVNLNQTNSLIDTATTGFVTEDEVNNIVNTNVDNIQPSNFWIQNYGTWDIPMSKYFNSYRDIGSSIQYTNSGSVGYNNNNTIIITYYNYNPISADTIRSTDGGMTFSAISLSNCCSILYRDGRWIGSLLSSGNQARFGYSNSSSPSSLTSVVVDDTNTEDVGQYGCVIGCTSNGLYAVSNSTNLQWPSSTQSSKYLFYSNDNGLTWNRSANNFTLRGTSSWNINVCSRSNEVSNCLIGTSKGVYYMSSNAGAISSAGVSSGNFVTADYFKGQYIAARDDGAIYSSNSGRNLTQVDLSNVTDQIATVYGSIVTDDFIFIYCENVSLISYDGINWFKSAITPRTLLSSTSIPNPTPYRPAIFVKKNNNQLLLSHIVDRGATNNFMHYADLSISTLEKMVIGSVWGQKNGSLRP